MRLLPQRGSGAPKRSLGRAVEERAAALPLLLGLALLLLGAGAAALPEAFDDDPEASRVDGDRHVNRGALDLADIRANNSPTIVRNPRDGRELAVSNRVDSPQFSCGLRISRDGGVSWSEIAIPRPRGEEPKCFAPDVAYGADGTLFLAFVTLKGLGNVPNAVWLSRLEADGRLSRPKRLLGKLSFQVRLVADPVEPGRLYLTWLEASDVALYQFTRPGNPLRFMRSDDGGRTWRPPVTVSAPGLERVVAPSLAVGSGDDLHVLYLDLGGDRLDYHGAHGGKGGPPYPGPWRLISARSGDGGRSWQSALVEPRLTPTERFIVFLPPFPSIAADRKGRVYASFHDGRAGDADAYLWRSEDGGRSWGSPQRINDTPRGDRTTQHLSELAVAPDGRLDVVYYDRRRDRRDRLSEVSFQSSFDHGGHFTEALRLAQRPFSSEVGFGADRGMADLGSRLGLVSTDRSALAVWPDTRAGTEISRKQDLAAAAVSFSRPARLSEPLKALLRFGGIALMLLGAGLVASSLRRSRRAAADDPA